MSDTPPKVTQFFTVWAIAAVPVIFFFIIFKSATDAHDVLCLGTIIFPILIIFLVIKLFDKYRENKPANETVQRLGLGDDDD